MIKINRWVSVGLLLVLMASTWVMADDDLFFLETIRGAQSIVVQRTSTDRAGKAGVKPVELRPGAKLKTDDLIETGSAVSVRVIYPDGSTAVIGRSSKVYVVSMWSRKNRGGVQGGELLSGQVRWVVRRTGTEDTRKRYRFVVKTRAAVLGVRGTDFVVELPEKSEKMELHTLQGGVDLGTNSRKLNDPKGKVGSDFVTVARNQFVAVAAGGVLPQPQAFDRDQYMQQLLLRQPEMDTLAEMPLPESVVNSLTGGAPGAGTPAAAPDGSGKSSNYYIQHTRDAIKKADELQQKRSDEATGQ